MSEDRAWRSGNVLALGLVSLFTDASSEMVVPLLPAFLVGVLGAGAATLGLVEGASDAVASLLKYASGRRADRIGRNRPLVLGGYGLSSAVRPLVALAGTPIHVLAVRVLDRVGKGVRTTPRDALLAGSVPESQRGSAFGVHRALDHTGAVIGPMLALAVLAWRPGDLRAVFALCAIPAVFAMAVLLFGVKETAPAHPRTAATREPVDPRLWTFLVPAILFTLGNSSDTFLLLAAEQARAPLTTLPLLWMGLHVVKATSSVLGGRLADRYGPRLAVGLGWGWYALIYTALAFTTDHRAIVGLVLAYGLYHGLDEGPSKALVVGLGGKPRGEALGLYHLCVGLATLPASLAFGLLWDHLGHEAAFATGAVLAIAALVGLAGWTRDPKVVPAGSAEQPEGATGS